MKKTVTKIVVALLLASALGCAQQLVTMRGNDVPVADQAPRDLPYQGKRPGELRLIERTFEGQPPLIPHSIVNYEEITASDNPCIACHMSSDFKGKKMPRVSDSHLAVLPTAANPDPVLSMTRWQCNSCHVPQVDAKPLIENSFQGLNSPR
jgi:nitrate reductase (cytochrome), electron transfer subunit